MIVREVIAQGVVGNDTFADVIPRFLARTKFDQLDVAVAYATRAGLRALEVALGQWPARTRWIVGLDDAITQPEAIDDLIQLAPGTVWLAELGPQGRRFHPKVYCFSSSRDEQSCAVMLGSANMTHHGLNLNAEVGLILLAESATEARELKNLWESMRQLARDPAEYNLQAYRDRHARARLERRQLADQGVLPSQPEAEEPTNLFDGTPASASVAWTEGASPSAGGRDLEFPRDMMPFFRLRRSPTTKRFRMAPNRPPFALTFTERTDNQIAKERGAQTGLELI
jgi:HKD family nuclease